MGWCTGWFILWMAPSKARRGRSGASLAEGDSRRKDKKAGGWYSGWTKYIITEVRDFFLLLAVATFCAIIWGICFAYFYHGAFQ